MTFDEVKAELISRGWEKEDIFHYNHDLHEWRYTTKNPFPICVSCYRWNYPPYGFYCKINMESHWPYEQNLMFDCRSSDAVIPMIEYLTKSIQDISEYYSSLVKGGN